MSIQKTNFIKILAAGGLLTLAGCSMNQSGSSVSEIAALKHELPKQIKWKQTKNESAKGNLLSEWIPEGSNANNTPVRVIYQRISPSQSTADFMSKAVMPLKKVCADLKSSAFKTTSTYTDQGSSEIICSQLGKNKFGTVSYVSVFTDKMANHVLVSEIKMPASKKAGVLKFNNEKQKQQAENSKLLAKLMYQFNVSTRVCDKSKNCQ